MTLDRMLQLSAEWTATMEAAITAIYSEDARTMAAAWSNVDAATCEVLRAGFSSPAELQLAVWRAL